MRKVLQPTVLSSALMRHLDSLQMLHRETASMNGMSYRQKLEDVLTIATPTISQIPLGEIKLIGGKLMSGISQSFNNSKYAIEEYLKKNAVTRTFIQALLDVDPDLTAKVPGLATAACSMQQNGGMHESLSAAAA